MFGQDYLVQATHSITLLCRADGSMVTISLIDRSDLWKHLLRLLLVDTAHRNRQDACDGAGRRAGAVTLSPYTCTF